MICTGKIQIKNVYFAQDGNWFCFISPFGDWLVGLAGKS